MVARRRVERRFKNETRFVFEERESVRKALRFDGLNGQLP
jgi:hypothetical protein